jgi:5-methylcytosine-specific restriction protein A
MPFKPMKPCKHPGCPNLVPAGKLYCDQHAPLHRDEIMRPPAAKRGYGARWQRLSRAYLKSHPLCVKCLEQGRYTKATVVDHRVPHRGDPVLFWDESNWQALCKPCHDRKTFTEDNHPVYHY